MMNTTNSLLSALFHEVYKQGGSIHINNLLNVLAIESRNSPSIINADLWKVNIFHPADQDDKFINGLNNNNYLSLLGYYGYTPNKEKKEEFVHKLDNSFLGYLYDSPLEPSYELFLSKIKRKPEIISVPEDRVSRYELDRLISIPINRNFVMGNQPDYILNLYIDSKSEIQDEYIKIISNFLSYSLLLSKTHASSNLIKSVMAHFENFSKNTKDLKSILNLVIVKLLQYIKFEACSIFIWDPIYHELKLVKTTSSKISDSIRTSYYPGEGKTGTVFKTGKSLIIDDMLNNPPPEFNKPITREVTTHDAQSFIAIPILNSSRPGDVLGVMRIVNKLNCNSSNIVDFFSFEDYELIRDLCSLLALYLEFEQSERRRTAFAKHMVHETMAPIAAIRADIGRTIAKDFGRKLKDWQFEENLKLTIENIDLLAAITTNVAYVWKQSEGVPRSEMYKVTEDINFRRDILDNATKMIFPLIRSSNLNGENIILEGGNFNICADKTAFVQVFINLLSNSIKYRKLDSIPISPNIWIKCHEFPDGNIEIDIVDYGIGIQPESIERIFHFGFREKNIVREDVRGLGIGLTVVKKIINDFYSTIEIFQLSNPTVFRIKLSGKLRSIGYIKESGWMKKEERYT